MINITQCTQLQIGINIWLKLLTCITFFVDCMLIKMTVIVISLELKSIINQTIFHNLCALNWNNPVHFRAKTFIRNSENVNLVECIRGETPAICFCLVYILNEIKKRTECEARAYVHDSLVKYLRYLSQHHRHINNVYMRKKLPNAWVYFSLPN